MPPSSPSPAAIARRASNLAAVTSLQRVSDPKSASSLLTWAGPLEVWPTVSCRRRVSAQHILSDEYDRPSRAGNNLRRDVYG